MDNNINPASASETLTPRGSRGVLWDRVGSVFEHPDGGGIDTSDWVEKDEVTAWIDFFTANGVSDVQRVFRGDNAFELAIVWVETYVGSDTSSIPLGDVK